MDSNRLARRTLDTLGAVLALALTQVAAWATCASGLSGTVATVTFDSTS